MVCFLSMQKHVMSFALTLHFILNLLETVSTSMIKEKAVELITSILSKSNEDEGVVAMGIRAIAALVDSSE